ncbi:MAG: hypothetical protein WC870_03170 [Candidatus Paceibacterota bacterium]
MQKRNVLNSPRLVELKKRRQKAILNKVLISLLGFSVIFILLAYISRFDNLNITEIQISGNKILETEILQTTVEQQISNKYLWLFPKTNILIYPKNAVKEELKEKFKRLKDVNLSIKNNKILEVSLTERIAKYTWCGTVMPAQVDPLQKNVDTQKCYFLDEDGYLFDEAPYFSGEVYFKFYGLTNLNDEGIGAGFYFSEPNFKQLISFKNALESMELKPTSLYIKENDDIEIFLSRGKTLPTGPRIILKKDSDFDKVAENLQTAITTEPLKSKLKNKYSSLLYIDLRFGNKVYYKFQ